ncbi:MAG: hypothetical protein PHD01_07140 [Geobacteraceae bacterium]|nr:hypothetical protein [Geobacteraceae bacterium]
MPRQPRLDIPGLVPHVMARGIEGGNILKTGKASPHALPMKSISRMGHVSMLGI